LIGVRLELNVLDEATGHKGHGTETHAAVEGVAKRIDISVIDQISLRRRIFLEQSVVLTDLKDQGITWEALLKAIRELVVENGSHNSDT